MILISFLQNFIKEYINLPQKPVELTLSLTELISFTLIVFQIGYYLGRSYKDIQPKHNQSQSIAEVSFGQQILIQKKIDRIPTKDIDSSSEIKDDATTLMVVVDAAQNKKFKTSVIQNILFKQHIPLASGKKKSLNGTFQVMLQNIGKQFLKTQRYEIVTKFDKRPQLELEIGNLDKTLRKVIGDKELNLNKMGLKVELQKNYINNTTEILFKNINSIESIEGQKKKNIQVSESCENGKFRHMFNDIIKIGEGGFGCVYKAVNKIQNRSYAIKIIYLKDLKKNDFLKQVTIISHISHQNIVRYYTWWIEEIQKQEIHLIEKQYDFTPSSNIGLKKQISKNFSSSNLKNISLTSEQDSNGIYFDRDDNKPSKVQEKQDTNKIINKLRKESIRKNIKQNQKNIYSLHIQMELCTGGSLARYLKINQRVVNPSVAFSIFDQILKGISALHSNGIIHRDLKPGNIFLSKHENLVKIGDFGLSTLVSKEPNMNQYILSNNLGTPSYMAPELYKKQKILKPELLDIYSLGIIYFELLSNFKTEYQRITSLQKIKQGVIELKNFEKQRKLIRFMTRSIKTRYTLSDIRQSDIYLDLYKQFWIKNWGELL